MPAAKLMAVLGTCRRRGRWEISSKTNALVVFGHCYVDFRQAYADPEIEKITMSVMCLFGNTTFLMPEGADVKPSATSVLASTAFEVPDSDAERTLPTIHMDTTTLLGRVRVLVAPDETEEHQPADDSAADESSTAGAPVDRIGGTATHLVVDEEPPPSVAVEVPTPPQPPAIPTDAIASAEADEADSCLFDALGHVDEPREMTRAEQPDAGTSDATADGPVESGTDAPSTDVEEPPVDDVEPAEASADDEQPAEAA